MNIQTKEFKIGDEVWFYEYGFCGNLVVGNVKAVNGDYYLILSHCGNEWFVNVDCLHYQNLVTTWKLSVDD